MNPTVAAYVLLAFVLAMALLDRTNNPGYSCPACGTKRKNGHSKDCSWRQHYGEDF